MRWVKCKQQAVKRATQGTAEHMNHPKRHCHSNACQAEWRPRATRSDFARQTGAWIFKWNFTTENWAIKLIILKVDKSSIYPVFLIQIIPNSRWEVSLHGTSSANKQKENDIVRKPPFCHHSESLDPGTEHQRQADMMCLMDTTAPPVT